MRDGYCVVDQLQQEVESTAITSLDARELVRKLEAGAHLLAQAGWPATFLAMFDEAYQLAEHCQQFMTGVTQGKNTFSYDVVGFYVQDGVGFSPHRDRQPEDWQPHGHADEHPLSTFDP